jgi:hypothetical protein
MFRKTKISVPIQRKTPKVRMPKALRNAFVSAGTLLVLIVLGGVAYTYLVGPSGPQSAAVVAPALDDPVIKPTIPADNAPASAAIQVLTTPVTAGSNASISVRTVPGSTCTIAVAYNHIASTDSGLATKAADDFGTVSWTWTVDSTAPVGTWPVKVTCVYHSRIGVVIGDLQVSK